MLDMIATQVVCRINHGHRSAAAVTHTHYTADHLRLRSQAFCETHGSMKTWMQEYNVRKN